MRIFPHPLREAYVALIGSWFMVGALYLITVGSLLTRVDDALGYPQRIAGLVLCTICSGLFLATQLILIRGSDRRHLPALVMSQVVLALTLLVWTGTWTTLGLAMAAVALTLDSRRAVAATLAVALVGHTFVLVTADRVDTRAGIPLTNWVTAIILYAITRLIVVHDELRRTREHLARVRVDEERTRISRDLHDIMGRTLVAVSLRNETAIRLVEADPAAAKRQLEQAQATLQDGQRQLRALTSGPVIAGLRGELDTAQSLCDRLGVRCTIAYQPVTDAPIDATLAAVVREAVTNMLKHSRPRVCQLAVTASEDEVTLSVLNDGALAAATPDSARTGLLDMTARVAALGGTLTAEPLPDRRYRVTVRVPRGKVAASGREEVL